MYDMSEHHKHDIKSKGVALKEMILVRVIRFNIFKEQADRGFATSRLCTDGSCTDEDGTNVRI